MSNSIMHFEIPVDDLARAKRFYESIFGWTITPFPMPPGQEYYGVTTKEKGEPGIDGGMRKRTMPDQPFTNYITVASIDATNEAIKVFGGTIVLPKQEIGGNMGWISAFKDTENNLIGLHQRPATRGPRAVTATTEKRSVRRRTAKKSAARRRR
jgi:uncharacterized protein